MIFNLNKIGTIKEAKIEIGDITIICGENNTGKTYATYSIYGFLDMLNRYGYSGFLRTIAEDDSLFKTDNEWFLFDRVTMYHIFDRIVLYYKNHLFSVLSGKENDFKDSVFEINGFDFDANRFIDVAKSLNFDTKLADGRDAVKVKSLDDFKTNLTNEQKLYLLAIQYISKGFPNSFIISTERTGAAIFYKELDINKNELLDTILQNQDGNAMIDNLVATLLNKTSRYPKPVSDNINFIRDLENISKNDSFISKLANEGHNIESLIKDSLSEIAGGKYTASQGSIEFSPGLKRKKYAIQQSSSSAKSLLMLYYYIVHVANNGDMLIIDEPELNLHPKNQILVARLLVLLVNTGIKVFITTHSDYIVREINNCIALNSVSDDDLKTLSDNRYTKYHRLDAQSKSIKAYIASANKKGDIHLRQASINNLTGIDMTTFSDAIAFDLKNQEEIADIIFKTKENSYANA